MKRIISTILTVSMLLGIFQIATAQDNTVNTYQSYIEIVVGLGLMSNNSNGEFEEDSEISRGEFAQIISGILNYSDQNAAEAIWEFYGVDNEKVIKEVTDSVEKVSQFADIEASSEYFDAIDEMTRYKLMSGVGENTFAPDRSITVAEAVTVLVNLLGYRFKAEVLGGYFNGYAGAANIAGLRYSNPDNLLTRGEAAKLICNALELDMMTMSVENVSVSFSVSKGTTILGEMLKIEKLRGRVVQNNITSLTGESSLNDNEIQIDDVVLTVTEGIGYVNDMIGRMVECYYINDDGDRQGEIVFCRSYEKGSEYRFDIEDFEEYKDNKISYNEGNKTVTKRITDVPYCIYNGMAVKTIKPEYFEHDQGSVTLVSTDNGACDLIIIEGYESWYVKSIFEENGVYTVVNMLAQSATSESKTLTIDTGENSKFVNIYDSKGKETSVLAIGKNMVIDVMRNGKLLKIIVSDNNIVKGYKITEMTTENEIGSGEDLYKVCDSYLNADSFVQYRSSNVYILYLNSFGNVAYMEADADENTWQIGYLMKFVKDDSDEIYYASMITGTKTKEQFVLNDKIKFSSQDGNEENVSKKMNDVMYELYLKDCKGIPLRYKMNNDDVITAIELPLNEGVKTKNIDRLYLMKDSKDNTDSGYYYTQGARHFGAKIFLENNTTVLTVPEDSKTDDVNLYSYTAIGDINNGYKKFRAYGVNQESKIADFICLYDSVSLNYGDRTEALLIVTNVTAELNGNEEPINKLTAYGNGKYYTYYDSVENDYINHANPFSLESVATENIDEKYFYSVEKGDIIRLKADSFNNIQNIQILFDANGVYNNAVYEDKLKNAQDWDLIKEFNNNGQVGILAGTIGYFSPYVSNTNPVTSKNLEAYAGASNGSKNFDAGSPRWILGYVVDYRDGLITFTTKNLHNGGLPDETDTRYITETRRISTVRDTMTLDGKSLTVSGFKDSDIRSYNDYDQNCSRILFQSWMYDDRYGIIINGSR